MVQPQKKILTVTIPTWNRASLLSDLLEQLIQQIIADNLQSKVEVLISNNGSDDNTEQIGLEFKSKFSFITYNNNEKNIGARDNVLKCMEIANAEFLILLGDDDRINNGALKRIIECLENNPDTGILLDNHNFKKNPFTNGTALALNDYILSFYYNIGNAGIFIVKTSFIREILQRFDYYFFSRCWPQTQVMILAANHHPENKYYTQDLNINATGFHGQVMIYTSYYLWITTYFDLVESNEKLRLYINKTLYLAAKKYFQNNVVQLFFNILQCGIFVDDSVTRKKTADHISQNIYLFSLKEKLFLRIIVLAFNIPNSFAKIISNAFILLTRGKMGLKKKNDFVNAEIEKRKKGQTQSKVIRGFVFEN